MKGNSQNLAWDFGFDSVISLDNFFGIEIDDFAVQIARLSLWLAEHQMNVKFHEAFGQSRATLPLKDSGHIVQGNSLRLDWQAVCPIRIRSSCCSICCQPTSQLSAPLHRQPPSR